MGDRPAVVFDSVWKKFKRGERHDSLRDLVPATLKRMFRPSPVSELSKEEFWALRDVSFEVKPGEALGIIGPNGAGKSTALKLLTRIMKPSMGRCHVIGRVGALIEVASGFHPDLTGRENVFLQGAIMGMSRAQVTSRFDEIVAFAGVEPHIDTPIKRYSSGMQARLGFSIAAHLDPDVLFVDEVLSVGDIAFQSRCLDRMREHVRRGTTLVFVSHNLQAVAALCQRCLVFGGGRLLHDGPTEAGFTEYLKAGQLYSWRPGVTDEYFRLRSAVLGRARNAADGLVRPHEACTVELVFDCVRDAPPVNVGFEFQRTRDLFYAYGVTTHELGYQPVACRAGDTLRVDVRFVAHFARGHYRINIHMKDPKANRFLASVENAANFTVDEPLSWDGVVEPELSVHLTTTGSDALVACGRESVQ